MGHTTILLMIITILSKIFGFVRESVMAAVIGAGDIKSIYVTATTIPDIMMYTVITGIVSAYITVYTRIRTDKSEAEANSFTSNLINVLMVYGAIIFLLIIIFAGPISKIFSPKLIGETHDMATSFTRIMAVSIFAFLYSAVIRGFLNARNNFIDPVITEIILNIFVISATLLTGVFDNPYILIIGALIGNIVQFIRFPFASKKKGFSYERKLDFKDPYIKYLLAIMIPIIISNAANKISVLIDKSMASGILGIDTVAKVFYTENMLDFIVEVVTINIATITFPQVAKLGNEGKIDAMKEKTASTLILTLALVIPATFGMMTLARPIISLIYERNAFTAHDAALVSSLLVSYAPYIIFITFMKIISNSFYAVGDSKSPLVVILIQQAINVSLNWILAKEIGLDGIGIATSVSTAVGSLLIIFVYFKKFGKVKDVRNMKSIGKITLAAIFMGLVANISYGFFESYIGLGLGLIVSILLSVIIYLFILYKSKINPVSDIIEQTLYEINL
ncbi:murein biosynthesis integral membrane protein MurJ [Anaerococcus marasmi]|uniref:murein biosynthesis integral membrane protein MurJ n=1 Tax=Anaerococcus marasmi TaxID=2057797 RepID=UPI000CFA1BD0|nr:murein biosynthesis integral membrane protein MurJ [Anaerococcus marasmi]